MTSAESSTAAAKRAQETVHHNSADDSDEEDEYMEEEEEEEEEEEVDDSDYHMLTQTLERERDANKYNPRQNKDERREIRQLYRELITKTEESKRDLTDAANNGLIRTLEKANALYSKVRNTQEATLDSKLLVLSAGLGAQKARNLRLDHQLFNIDEFVSKIKTLGRTAEADLDDDNESHLDWKCIGIRAIQYGKRARTIDFMLGPLSVERKQRRVTRQVRLVKNKEDLVQPTMLREEDIQQQENETSNNVNQIYKILDEQGPMNYFEFITNPEAFSQSVENMFYVSFLIRNGVAEIDDSSGQPMLGTRAPPTTDELANNLLKKQIIMSLDIPLWKEIIDTYGIQTSVIPTRASRQEMAPGKWY
ncbi:Nse4 C-terminal-domain-containing protein [Radiomyces spectabilis]|uniref:Nse4 C-terminal-domain-containing protein n=1 Tax=Radiomyces spectabilis TaxID=64574 RepID=UPI00221E9AB4|nr:Nse4 C-terminal-domain-containing protein [Radiomyces spectabilis]KAI8379116.1 Nse4 C-terminal-domain-containing protein [Radiomyces spectabilis]